MTKTYCDRCGNEIHKEYGWLKSTHYFTKSKLSLTNPTGNWKDDDKYICPSCVDSYIHWFMNPEPQKEE